MSTNFIGQNGVLGIRRTLISIKYFQYISLKLTLIVQLYVSIENGLSIKIAKLVFSKYNTLQLL